MGTEVSLPKPLTQGAQRQTLRTTESLLFPVSAVYHTLYSFAKVEDMEVDQQADGDSAQSHIGQQLCLMDGMERLNAFHLDDDGSLDYQVYPVTEINFFAVIDDGQADLASDTKPAFCQFMLQAGLICAFQQSRPE